MTSVSSNYKLSYTKNDVNLANTEAWRVLEGSTDSQRRGFGFFLMVCIMLALAYVAYLLFKRWRSVREFHELEATNAHADNVLDEMNIRRSDSRGEANDVDNKQAGIEMANGSRGKTNDRSNGRERSDSFDDELI